MPVQTPRKPPPAPRAASARPSPGTPNTAPVDLEPLLHELLAAYEELGALAAEHRAAISRADGAAIEVCARRESDLARRLGVLDERRRAIAAARGAPPGQRVTLSSVVDALPEPSRARAGELTTRLRELVRRVQREYATIRAATHALVGHIDGLVQQVGQRLNGAGTYGPEGRVDSGGVAACGIDVTR